MSGGLFGLPPTPLMTPERARDVGRAYKAFATHLTDLGVRGEAGNAERQIQWWLRYSISLAQTPPTEEPN